MTNNDTILELMDADSIGLEMSETIKNYKMLYGLAPSPAVDLENDADQLKIAQTTQESQGGGASIPENYFKCQTGV